MTKEQIRELRVTMQALLDNYWNIFEKSRETAMAYTELQYARMWMGKLLGAMGEENPYSAKDGNRKEVDDILPTSDTKPEIMFQLSGNQIEKADQLREWIKQYLELPKWYEIFSEVKDYPSKFGAVIEMRKLNVHNIYSHLAKARMVLGLYLAELYLKETKKNTNP